MSGPLALVGGDEWSDGCTFDRGLLEAAAAGGGAAAGPEATVVVLATAAAYERPVMKVEAAERWFAGLGARMVAPPVYGRIDALDEDLARTVRSAQFLYLSDGGSMHLRSVLKDTPVFEAIVGAWSDGAVLAGSGAGADVLCDPMVDPRGGAYTVGLGVVANLALIPRYDTWSKEKAHRTVGLAPSGLTVVGVPRRTALIRGADGVWSAEGVGEVDVWIDGEPASIADLAV